MSRQCSITGKKPSSGNLRSFSNRATKRRFLPNLVAKRIFDSTTKKFIRKKIAVSTLRTLLKQNSETSKRAVEMLK